MKTLNLKKALLINVFLLCFSICVVPVFLEPDSNSSADSLELSLAKAGEMFLFCVPYKLVLAMLALVFILYYRKELPTSISEMFSLKRINPKVGFATIILVVAARPICQFVHMLVHCGRIDISFEFLGTLIFLTVELANEIVYRGLAMNAFSKVTSLKKANILQAGFFGFAYSLAWTLAARRVCYRAKYFSTYLFLYFIISFLYFFLVGCISGRVFYKTRSLWGPTAVSYIGSAVFNLLSFWFLVYLCGFWIA